MGVGKGGPCQSAQRGPPSCFDASIPRQSALASVHDERHGMAVLRAIGDASTRAHDPGAVSVDAAPDH